MPQKNIDNKKVGSPYEISFSGWKAVLVKVKDQIGENNVIIVSAGVGFFGFLAIFPAIMALISIYGLVMDPQQIEEQLTNISSMMPEQTYKILQQRADNFINSSGGALGWGTAFGILFGIWIANVGTKSLFKGIDIAYKTRSYRGILKHNGLTLLFTFGAIILIILSAGLIVAFPAIVEKIGLPDNIENLISWLRWPIMGLILVGSISLIYNFAPGRMRPKFKWVIPGALLASILWLLASWAFSIYIRNFWNLGEIYGSISAVVILMLWLFLTSFIILLGAELNAELENHAFKEPEVPND
ncbi:MAG: YihY/virulence factor BrkB family protein [Cyclobacteriaceae bacterium]